MLFLYARVVEICDGDDIQSKGLSLALGQIKNHAKVTDVGPSPHYNLIRFVLNNARSAFGFKTFIVLVHHCVTSSGNKLLDYDLLDKCLLSSWRTLIRIRCTDAEAPTGRRTLFECLLTVILDLLLEKNMHRTTNIATLKSKDFVNRILSICCNMIFECKPEVVHPTQEFITPVESTTPTPSTSTAAKKSSASAPKEVPLSPLSCIDALRICALVKSIFMELMAPPDAYACVAIVKYGMFPLLPKECPPLPRKEDAFFLYQTKLPSFATIAEEQTQDVQPSSSLPQVAKFPPTVSISNHDHDKKTNENKETLDDVVFMNEDIPEIVGKTANQKAYNKGTFKRSQYDAFQNTFQESLVEALMSVLLNALAILPDGAFFSILRPHVNSHLFVAYCSHTNVTIKTLALKLLSSYLSRVKNPCVTAFLNKNKGFFLTSLYLHGEPEMAPVVSSICQGFGPVSYPLALSLLENNTILTTILTWVQEDEPGTIPALMSLGIIPTILNCYKSVSLTSTIRQLNALISYVIRYNILNSKEDPWKVLFCPALESGPNGSPLLGRFYREAISILKNYPGKDLRKSDYNHRVLWLMERSAASRFGHNFDKWLLSLFASHIMEVDQGDALETENWIGFVKNNKKRLTFLMGVCLSKIFVPHKVDFDTKQQVLKVLLQNCSNLESWLPKVLKSDASMERCFTAFLRLFLSEATQKERHNSENYGNGSPDRVNNPSFESLLTESNNLSLKLNPNLPPRIEQLRHDDEAQSEDVQVPLTELNQSEERNQPSSERNSPTRRKDAEKAIREKFISILVHAGILSPTNNFSTFSADFRNFKLLLETPPVCGVSYQELKQCLALLEKTRTSITPSISPMAPSSPSSPTQNNESVRVKNSSVNKGYFCNATYFESIFEVTANFAVQVVESVTRTRTQMGVEVIKSICTREDDIIARRRWLAITEQLGHPKAPWHFADLYPKFSSLDQSEGPGRMRLRLHKEHLKIPQRFILPDYRISDAETCHPLDYLLLQSDTSCDELMKFPTIKTEIQYMRLCMRIIPGEEIRGEVILSTDTLYFIPDLNKNSGERSENLEVSLTYVVYILRRRFAHENRGVEIFVGSQSYLFIFASFKDREEFMSFIQIKQALAHQKKNVIMMDSSLSTMTYRWTKGLLSNYDYLMYLNTASGRTYCDLMQYPVFPFVLAKYDTLTLDLNALQSYRDLRRPMAIQDPSKEEHFMTTYNYLKREMDFPPFFYGSHYSNSGIVLHYLIRLPPYTQHFLQYQDGNFDIPDRSFHSLETTWRLAAKESNTDFKEAIPEFYYLPEILKNTQHFNFGVRQNGQRVDHVELPPWAKKDPRLFILINRQALESNHVRKLLCDWIDLVFGYKQSGKPAVQAMNVFHPSTYEGFDIEGVSDELSRKARRAMVAHYGQTPKQLFSSMHPRSMWCSVENCEMEVLDTVSGIKWGYFLGSPTCSELEMVNTREYSDEMCLFETQTRILFWPKGTLIMGDTVVGAWSSHEIQIKSKVIHLCIGDEITACATTEKCIWIGYQSGRITVLKLSLNLENIMETFDLVGHYKPIKCIDLNFEFNTAVSCSGENHAIIWDMTRVAYINIIQRPYSIDSVNASRSTGDIVTVSLSTNTVTLSTINGFEIGRIQPEEKVESACLSGLDPGKNVNLIAVGCDYGHIKFYSTWDLKFISDIKVVPLASLPIQRIRYSKDGRRLYCLYANEEVSISAALQLPNSPG
ncbi:lysosomal-trafficking regulator isoform X2 [Folsomia candida]|nr:lysosomal-trafficking regulator isoform X2 [Folsomia candida]